MVRKLTFCVRSQRVNHRSDKELCISKLIPAANFQISYEVFGDRELVFGSDCIYNERKIVRKVLYKHVA